MLSRTKPEIGLVLSQIIYCDAHLNSLEMTVTRPEQRKYLWGG